MLPSTTVPYQAGRCGLCDRTVHEDGTAQVVPLYVFGPAACVTLQCWLRPVCRPTPATVAETTGHLLARVLSWYRSTLPVLPTRQVANNA